MGRSYLPRWKFTDSCGRPQTSGAIHVGCSHCDQALCAHTSRRSFLKTGIAIVGAAGMATVVDPRELFAQVRVFPPPPPAVSPIAGLMDTHVHAAPDVFGRALDDEEVAIIYRDRGLEALVLKNHVATTADRAGRTGRQGTADGEDEDDGGADVHARQGRAHQVADQRPSLPGELGRSLIAQGVNCFGVHDEISPIIDVGSREPPCR